MRRDGMKRRKNVCKNALTRPNNKPVISLHHSATYRTRIPDALRGRVERILVYVCACQLQQGTKVSESSKLKENE